MIHYRWRDAGHRWSLLLGVLVLLLIPVGTAAAAGPPAFILKWGTPGSGNSQFNNPTGVAVDGSGNVYVTDQSNNRIQKFTSSGVFLTKWGTLGSGNGQFNGVGGIAVDGSGNVYVVDGIDRIQKFTSSGVFLTKWGTHGSGNGQFNGAYGIAADNSGNVYVADGGNHRIQKFKSSGGFLLAWGVSGSGNGQFNSPAGIAVDGSGNVYVVDVNDPRIQKFTSSGVFLAKWGTAGSANGQFDAPHGVAVDGSGNVYVSDGGNRRIQKFTGSGVFLTKWGSFGLGNNQFAFPAGVTSPGTVNVYVADIGGNRVQKFAYNGPNGPKSLVHPLVHGKGTTATKLASSLKTSVYGQRVTFTATVRFPGGGKTSGRVMFSDGSRKLVTRSFKISENESPRPTDRTALFTTSSLTASTHSITARYIGTANGGVWRNSASKALVHRVGKAATRLVVTSSANPSVYGQAVTFTATVRAVAPGGGTPRGSVRLKDGRVDIGAFEFGKASFTTSSLAVGTHTITASYSGSANFARSSSPMLPLMVNKAATMTVVTSSPNPSVFGQSVTFTATVRSVAPGVGKPTGSVQFTDSGVALGAFNGDFDGDGRANFTTSALGVGTHMITATYSGSANFAGSVSTVLMQTVSPAAVTSPTFNPALKVEGGATGYTVTGSGWDPGCGNRVTVTSGGDVIGEPKPDSNGSFKLESAKIKKGDTVKAEQKRCDGNGTLSASAKAG